MHLKKIYIPAVIALLLTGSCYYDSVDLLYPNANNNNNNCDTANYKFSTAVGQIITDNCLSCHNNNIQNGSVNLEGYANVKTYADNGKITSVIQWSGAHNMPPDAKLPQCSITKIEKWVKAGAQND